VVLAHERVHLERGDPPVNAALALLTCVNWFNPAAHVMSHWLKIDQELACDARVVAAHPKARKAYAQAMLKTQLAARPLAPGLPLVQPSAGRARAAADPPGAQPLAPPGRRWP
jgi:beta-lactamase regulating signal transducer with metallopeptidase domain